MAGRSLQVLYEDNHLLAVLKPPGLATMGVTAGKPSLIVEAKQYLKRRYRKPGNVYLGVVSRLDAPVSGVVLFARTSKAAARLSEQFRTREVQKTYWALVEGDIRPASGELRDWLIKDERKRRMRTCEASTKSAQEGRLAYRRLKKLDKLSLVEVELETGRKHQIRVQLAEHGFPVIGDRQYGSSLAFSAGIALHARRLVFAHPVTKARIELAAPLPSSWKKYGIAEDLADFR